WDLPGDVACVRVHGDQTSPWWFLARPVAKNFAISVLHPRGETVIGTRPIHAASIVKLGRAVAAAVVSAFDLFLRPADQRTVMRLNIDVTSLRIRSSAAPVGSAIAGENHRALRRCASFVIEEWSERARVI